MVAVRNDSRKKSAQSERLRSFLWWESFVAWRSWLKSGKETISGESNSKTEALSSFEAANNDANESSISPSLNTPQSRGGCSVSGGWRYCTAFGSVFCWDNSAFLVSDSSLSSSFLNPRIASPSAFQAPESLWVKDNRRNQENNEEMQRLKKTFQHNNSSSLLRLTLYKNPSMEEGAKQRRVITSILRMAKPRVLFADRNIFVQTIHSAPWRPTCNVKFVRAESNLINFWGEDCRRCNDSGFRDDLYLRSLPAIFPCATCDHKRETDHDCAKI